MLSKRNISVCGIVIFLFFFFITAANAADAGQIISDVEEILKTNPVPAGEKIQLIKIAQDDTITLFVIRFTEGAELKPHFHKTHREMVYVVKGTGQMLLDGGKKVVKVKSGSLHFNPMLEVHALKNTGSGDLVLLSIFTPALKGPDRHFVQ
jgi:quercetin dioxygenase-like cupin family protein